jgi:hypothetical protein
VQDKQICLNLFRVTHAYVAQVLQWKVEDMIVVVIPLFVQEAQNFEMQTKHQALEDQIRDLGNQLNEQSEEAANASSEMQLKHQRELGDMKDKFLQLTVERQDLIKQVQYDSRASILHGHIVTEAGA